MRIIEQRLPSAAAEVSHTWARARAREECSPVDDVIETASLGHREVLAVIAALGGGLRVEVL